MPTTPDIGSAERTHPAAAGSVITIRTLPWTSGLRLAPLSVWLWTLVVSGAAIASAWVLAGAPLVVILAVVAGVAAMVAVIATRFEAAPLVLGLVPATAIANSGIIPASTYFVPTAILGVGLILWTAAWVVRGRRLPPLPHPLMVAFAVTYLAAACLSTLFSIDKATSVRYLVAIFIVVLVSLWLGPWILSRSGLIASLLMLIVAAGIAATVLGLILGASGPILWFGRWLGAYSADELTLLGQPRGIIFLRNSGPFLAPGSQALVLMAAILASLSLRAGIGLRRRMVVDGALVLLVVAMLTTFARVGWAGAVVGSGFIAVLALRTRTFGVAPAVIGAVLALAFVALLTNTFGADYRPDATHERNARADAAANAGGQNHAVVPPIEEPEIPPSGNVPPVTPDDGATPRFQARGGSELSGRLELWSASVEAIGDSPLVGYGPGTNSVALGPYLQHGESRRLVGLTSHNTWLRTWLEFGLLGIVGFAGVAVAALGLGLRRLVAGPARAGTFVGGVLAIFLGLGVAQAFETSLLGGVTLPSFAWSLAAGLLAVRASDEAIATVETPA